MVNGLGSIGNFSKDLIQNYMDVLKNSSKEIQTPDNFINNEQGDLLKGSISKTQIADPELMSDWNVLTKNNSVNSVNNDNPQADLTADKTAKTFSQVIGNYITDVNNKQVEAENAVATFASGGKIDLHNVMIAMEKSSLSMQMTLQMRSKILQAYQEISRLQV